MTIIMCDGFEHIDSAKLKEELEKPEGATVVLEIDLGDGNGVNWIGASGLIKIKVRDNFVTIRRENLPSPKCKKQENSGKK